MATVATPVTPTAAESPKISPTTPRRESWWHWHPTSVDQAEEAERHMLAALRAPFRQLRVPVEGGTINTIVMGSGPPLVMVHGMAAGIGLWVANLEALAAHHTVYALDVPGFGRSDRLPFSGSTPEDGEKYFVGHLDAWRRSVGLDRFTLLGHSMGGYISSVYAMKHPQHVRHLVLADPWGIPHKPEDFEAKIKWQWRVAGSVLTKFNPLAVVRLAGPWGPDLLTKFRNDIAAKFAHLYPDSKAALDYIYHSNAQEPTGESAFSSLTQGLAWAKNPLIDRLPGNLDRAVPVSLIYGSHTWMDRVAGQQLAKQLNGTFELVANSGHHVYIDNAAHFNSLVLAETARHATKP